MHFEQLREFITKRMRMSHIYQPVMMCTLLESKGRASIEAIAKALLAEDRSQIEYYQEITRNMVGRVLREHGLVHRDGSHYVLPDFDSLTTQEVRELQLLCQSKLAAYIERRGRPSGSIVPEV
jgi:hypothetical protein